MTTLQLLRITGITALATLYCGCTIENITDEAGERTSPPPVAGPVDKTDVPSVPVRYVV